MSELLPDDKVFCEACIEEIREQIQYTINNTIKHHPNLQLIEQGDRLMEAATLGARMMFEKLADSTHGES